jgi:hypothetical protein
VSSVRNTLVIVLLFIACGIRMFGQELPDKPQRKDEGQKPHVNWLYGAYVPKDVPLRTMTVPDRFRLYVAQTFTTTGIYVKTAFLSITDQATNTPSEWGDGGSGFGKRVASNHATSMIQNSFSAVGNGLLRYEPRYDICKCSGTWPRVRHALIRNFLTYNRTEREWRPQIPLYAAAAGTGILSGTWLPDNKTHWSRASRSIVVQATFGSLSNLVGEFAPEIKRMLKRNKSAAGDAPR